MCLSICLDPTFVTICICVFFFFFFFTTTQVLGGQILLFINSSRIYLTFQPIFIIPIGPVYCSRDSQTSLFSNFFIKNRSHDTIHTFKNNNNKCYSVFSKNKLYQNRLLVWRSTFFFFFVLFFFFREKEF